MRFLARVLVGVLGAGALQMGAIPASATVHHDPTLKPYERCDDTFHRVDKRPLLTQEGRRLGRIILLVHGSLAGGDGPVYCGEVYLPRRLQRNTFQVNVTLAVYDEEGPDQGMDGVGCVCFADDVDAVTLDSADEFPVGSRVAFKVKFYGPADAKALVRTKVA